MLQVSEVAYRVTPTNKDDILLPNSEQQACLDEIKTASSELLQVRLELIEKKNFRMKNYDDFCAIYDDWGEIEWMDRGGDHCGEHLIDFESNQDNRNYQRDDEEFYFEPSHCPFCGQYDRLHRYGTECCENSLFTMYLRKVVRIRELNLTPTGR